MADDLERSTSGDPVTELIRDWARATAEVAHQIEAAYWDAERVDRPRASLLFDALYQAKVFVELIAGGQCLGVTLHTKHGR